MSLHGRVTSFRSAARTTWVWSADETVGVVAGASESRWAAVKPAITANATRHRTNLAIVEKGAMTIMFSAFSKEWGSVVGSPFR